MRYKQIGLLKSTPALGGAAAPKRSKSRVECNVTSGAAQRSIAEQPPPEWSRAEPRIKLCAIPSEVELNLGKNALQTKTPPQRWGGVCCIKSLFSCLPFIFNGYQLNHTDGIKQFNERINRIKFPPFSSKIRTSTCVVMVVLEQLA